MGFKMTWRVNNAFLQFSLKAKFCHFYKPLSWNNAYNQTFLGHH